MKSLIVIPIIVLLFIYFSGCEESEPTAPDNLSTSKIISANNGGTITTEDGISLEFPPGALLQDTEITLTPIEGTQMHEWGVKAAHLEPDGLMLQKPALLKLPLPSDWPIDHTPLVFVSFGHDPAEYFDTGITADIIGAGNNLYAQTEILHFSKYGAIKNCHKGTLAFLLENFEQRGCNSEAVWQKVEDKYPGVNTDIVADPLTGHNTLQAFLGTYFQDIGGLNKDDLTGQKWNQIINSIESENKRIILLFTRDAWGEKNSDGFFNRVPHSATIEIKDGKLKLRNSASLNDNILRHIPDNVFWYPKENIDLTAEKLDKFRNMKTFEPIENELSDKPELFEHLPAISIRPVPWNAVRFYAANHSEDKNPCDIYDCEPGETVTDIDGNVYNTVLIGSQCWMAENLKVATYRDGSNIPNVPGDSAWADLNSGAWVYYENNPSYNETYGKLYNWYAVDDPRGLCPSGWHVPTDDEWWTLTTYLGGVSVAGGKMKSTRTEPDSHPRWNSPNRGATNESGFSGLPIGSRHPWNGIFDGLGSGIHIWSSTDYEEGRYAWARSLNTNRVYVDRWYGGLKEGGLAVRCLKN